MKFQLHSFVIAVLSVGYLATPVVAQIPLPQDERAFATGLTLRAKKPNGCYRTAGNLQTFGPYTYQSTLWCQALCVRQAKQLMALFGGSTCLCGDEADLPSSRDKVDDSVCNTPCQGFPGDTQCTFPLPFVSGVDSLTPPSGGGSSSYMIFDTAYQPNDPAPGLNPDYKAAMLALSSASASAAKSAAITSAATSTTASSSAALTPASIGASTIFVTESANQGSSARETIVTTDVAQAAPAGPNTAAIAAGVVAGIVVLCAIVGGLFFYRKQQKKKQAVGRPRNESMTNFVAHGKKPSSTYSIADSRLEPSVMAQRRVSDGSIADNRDYSRRILQVTNPDGR